MIDCGTQLKIILNDTIGSDHAPHLRENKDKVYPNTLHQVCQEFKHFNASNVKSC